MAVLAVDAGGTTLECGLVQADGVILSRSTVPVRPAATAAGYLEQVAAAVTQLASGARPVPEGLSLAMPGPLDPETGVVFSAPNLGPWRDAPVAEWLQERFEIPVTVTNDAEAAALGEGWLGAGRDVSCLVVYTLGTGVGGGILFDGRPWRGSSGAAGELGHVCVDPAGPRCACGATGCVEALAGRAGIRRLASAELGRELEPDELAALAERGDPGARRVYERVGRALGLAAAGIVATLAPDRIVYVGGVAAAWPHFSTALLATVREHTFAPTWAAVEIRPGELGERAGLLGAARAHYLRAQPGR